MMETAAEDVSGILKLLSNPKRLLILCQLVADEKSVGELARLIGASQVTVSQQLSLLKNTGVVTSRREAQSVFYRLDHDEIRQLIGFFVHHLLSRTKADRATGSQTHRVTFENQGTRQMHQTLADLVKDAKSRIREITAEELHQEMENNREHVIVDVREPGEFQNWRITGAMLIPRGVLEPAVDLDNPQRNQALANARGEKVVLYCGTGGRSALAADVLQKMGFTDIESLAGGITNWRNSGYPIEQN